MCAPPDREGLLAAAGAKAPSPTREPLTAPRKDAAKPSSPVLSPPGEDAVPPYSHCA